MSTYPKIIGPADVAEILSCSRSKVWKLRAKNTNFPKPKLVAGRPRWLESEILAYRSNCPTLAY